VAGDELEVRLIDAGLYDPGAENAPMRLERLVHLADRGATIEQMIEADRGERLVALVADLKMFDFGIPMTVEQVAEACHVSIDRVMRVRLASGLPAEPGASLPAWAPEDVAGFELGAGFFGEGPVLAFSRVMGASAARVAEAAISLFLSEIEESLDAFGASPVDHAQANEEAADLVSIISILMDHLVREHLDLAVKRQRASSGGWSRTVLEMGIGFVDLASSTEWATSISLREQADALALFESAAWDIATQRGGRIVKLIGDEAMFAVINPAEACRIALELCAAVDAIPSLPRARGAVGFGNVAIRDGDYYGPLVHIVARAVKAATEGGVVVTEGVSGRCEGSGTGLRFEPIGSQLLRGIEEPVPLFAVEAESEAS
jgi:adenylate cyclase